MKKTSDKNIETFKDVSDIDLLGEENILSSEKFRIIDNLLTPGKKIDFVSDLTERHIRGLLYLHFVTYVARALYKKPGMLKALVPMDATGSLSDDFKRLRVSFGREGRKEIVTMVKTEILRTAERERAEEARFIS